MPKTTFTLEVHTPEELTPMQRREIIWMLAEKVKELERFDRPLNNEVQRVFVVEQLR